MDAEPNPTCSTHIARGAGARVAVSVLAGGRELRDAGNRIRCAPAA
ncbi:MAG: hypothetical protein QOG42_1787 [Solirubrobacteraceae bacterium]|nr:hypothetical protein [Solirubrobacteraceae bacterium]